MKIKHPWITSWLHIYRYLFLHLTLISKHFMMSRFSDFVVCSTNLYIWSSGVYITGLTDMLIDFGCNSMSFVTKLALLRIDLHIHCHLAPVIFLATIMNFKLITICIIIFYVLHYNSSSDIKPYV